MRTELFEQADAKAKHGGYKLSPTGMYVSQVFALHGAQGGKTHLIEKMNVCAICIFIHDEPYNYGVLQATTYDGDCDDCGGESRFYSDGVSE